MKVVSTIGMSAAVALLASSALAQTAAVGVSGSTDVAAPAAPEAAPAPAPEPAPAPAPAAVADSNQGSSVGVGLPSAAPAAGDSDHSQVVGRFGVGFMGRQTMDISVNRTPINVPVIGVRYWLDNTIGIDAGLGFNLSSGSTDAAVAGGGTVSADKPGLTAFLLHAGVPLNLADSGHFSFQVVPEANIGFAGTGDYDIPGGTQSDSGFLLNIGARAGAEIQFGFMGIPQLSLQGSVGLYLQQQSGSTTTTPTGAGDQETSDSTFSIGTTLGPDPWDIFTSSISALYYF